jgi:replicative DNA helicase
VLLLAKLNREGTNRSGRPVLTDLQGSSEIEQHADTVLLLHEENEPGRRRAPVRST